MASFGLWLFSSAATIADVPLHPLPSWPAISALVPSANRGPAESDWVLAPQPSFSGTRPTLFRERNGWCPYSARAWLALEIKGLEFDTVRVDAGRYDGRPSMLTGSTPQVRWPDGSILSGSLAIMRELDERYPASTPLYTSDQAVDRLAAAYHTTFPGTSLDDAARDGAPMRVTAPRAAFEAAAAGAEALLGERPDGPYFRGASLSAADVAWVPFLERYAAWLPLLHPGLTLRNDARWPRLAAWFAAMRQQPAYACRVEGDVRSWRRVLALSPGWLVPPSRGWSPPTAEGAQNGAQHGVRDGAQHGAKHGVREGDRQGAQHLAEQEARTRDRAAPAAAARLEASAALWAAYAAPRPHVAPDASAEAAAHLVRCHEAIARDASERVGLEHGLEHGLDDLEALDAALRALAWLLAGAAGADAEVARATDGLAPLVAYLEQRLCVPRDMGGPAAAALAGALQI